MADDPGPLHLGADHEPGHVGKKEDGDVVGVAHEDEAGRLVGGVAEEHAPLVHRVVGDDAHDMPVEAGEAGGQLGGEEGLELEEGVGIDEAVDHPVHVVTGGLLGGQFGTGEKAEGFIAGTRRRPVAPPLGQVAE